MYNPVEPEITRFCAFRDALCRATSPRSEKTTFTWIFRFERSRIEKTTRHSLRIACLCAHHSSNTITRRSVLSVTSKRSSLSWKQCHARVRPSTAACRPTRNPARCRRSTQNRILRVCSNGTVALRRCVLRPALLQTSQCRCHRF